MRKMSWLESLSLDFASMPGTELPSIMEWYVFLEEDLSRPDLCTYFASPSLMSLSNLRQLSVEGWALPVESRVQLLELIEGRGGRFHCSNSDAVMLLRDLHLAAPSTTTYLLAHMDFSGVSAAWLAKAIARNTHIEVLDLRECHMEDGEAAAVLTACYGHHMLRELL